jgi:putative membrane protein insertion efficiency factor
MKWLTALLVLPIRIYQKVLSPLKPATCRFHPTCSHYAAEALTTHGPLKGLVLGTWRILRCQPFSREGLDPVPPKEDWRRPFRRGFRDPREPPDPPL